MNTKVILVDRQVCVRQLLRRYLEDTRSGFDVVAESGSGEEAIPLCQEHAAELLLVDPAFLEVPAAEIVRAVRRELPEVRVLLLASHHLAGLTEAIAAGVHGCVFKEEPLRELQNALEIVASGRDFFSAKGILAQRMDQPKLTARQREVLILIAAGQSTKEVATKLSISFKTADHHRTRLMKRLNVHDLAGLVRFAVRHGLIEV